MTDSAGTIAVTGSASGIGRATRARLEAGGHRVIGVDLRDAEVLADLGTPDGRAAMVEAVADQAVGRLQAVVAAAGITGEDGAAVVSVDHFGAVATLDGLRPLLGPGGAAVAICSNAATTQPSIPAAVVERCLADDEPGARALAAPDGIGAYGAAKLALSRWIRRQAVGPAWAGAGLRLNAVAPGFVDTPLTAGGWDFITAIADTYPVPVGRPGRPEEIAALITFLLSPEAAFFCGSIITVDGGTDAALRADHWPAALG